MQLSDPPSSSTTGPGIASFALLICEFPVWNSFYLNGVFYCVCLLSTIQVVDRNVYIHVVKYMLGTVAALFDGVHCLLGGNLWLVLCHAVSLGFDIKGLVILTLGMISPMLLESFLL